MSANTTNPPAPAVPAAGKPRRRKPGRSVVIPLADWKLYEDLLGAFEGHPGVRLTYDRGELEIMVPSHEHEGDADFLGRMIVILTEELGLDLHSGGSTTLKRKRMKKGLEPDRCFWIANASKVAGVRQLNLKIHPPPDLAIEVDVTRSSLDRHGIYRTLGVGELWRLDGDDLTFHVLGADKKYTEVPASPTFPGIIPGDLMSFVKQARTALNQNIPAGAFRAWLKQRVASAAGPPAPPTTP
jgi:Uma2 family endonuclease